MPHEPREHVLVGRDPVLGGVLDEIAARLSGAGRRVRRIPEGAGTAARPLPDGPLRELFAPARVAVVSSRTLVDARVLDAARRLTGVVFPSIGVNSCDLAAAAARGVRVCNGATPENVESMAESQLLAMLALSYRLPEKTAAFAARDQARANRLRSDSRMLRGRSLGFLGHGRITRAVLRRLRGWDTGPLLVHTRTVPAEADDPPREFVGLRRLLRRSEVLCVNVPLTPRTAGMLSAERLDLLPPGALVVVQSRGGIVDEQALAGMLRSGRLGGAAVDTFAEEPVPADHPLRAAPGALLTSHCIGHSAEMFASFADTAVQAVDDLLRGAAPRYPVPLT